VIELLIGLVKIDQVVFIIVLFSKALLIMTANVSPSQLLLPLKI